MTSHAGSTTSTQAAAARVFIAIEVSKRDWLIAGHTPCDGRTSGTSVAAVTSRRSCA
jgi:hypothetical protein